MTSKKPLELAATCLLLRPSPTGFEVLLVKRSENLSFGGQWSFPGGKLDPTDGVIRPVLDESTYAWGDPSSLAVAATAGSREVLEETGLTCPPSSLVWLSAWIPPQHGPPRRFGTWFFCSPDHSGDIVLNEESSDFRWSSPQEALEANNSGDFDVAIPTWVTLCQLALHDSIEALMDACVTSGARTFRTQRAPTPTDIPNAKLMMVWPGDPEHDDTEPLDVSRGGDAERRLVIAKDGSVAHFKFEW